MALEAKDVFLNCRDNPPSKAIRIRKNYSLSISTSVQLSIDHLIFIYIRIMITNRSMASVDEPYPAGLALAT